MFVMHSAETITRLWTSAGRSLLPGGLVWLTINYKSMKIYSWEMRIYEAGPPFG